MISDEELLTLAQQFDLVQQVITVIPEHITSKEVVGVTPCVGYYKITARHGKYFYMCVVDSKTASKRILEWKEEIKNRNVHFLDRWEPWEIPSGDGSYERRKMILKSRVRPSDDKKEVALWL